MALPGIYTQRDTRWSNLKLGYNDDKNFNLYHYGCLVTGIANMLWYNGNNQANPGSVNQWLKDNAGFEPGGGLVRWAALKGLLDQVQMVDKGYSSDLNVVNAFLKDPNAFAVAWITKPGFDMHWSVMPYVNTIADSWDGVLKSVGSYTFHGAHLFVKVLPLPDVPTPLPAPLVVAPEPAPVHTPIVAPAPSPVPTNTTPQPSLDERVSALEKLVNLILGYLRKWVRFRNYEKEK